MYLQNKPFAKDDVVYLCFASAFAVMLVLTNVIGIKVFSAPPSGFALTTGILTYPVTFWLTDVVCEIWGRRRANIMVLLGFAMSLLMLAVVNLARVVPAHDYWVAPGNEFGYTTAAEYQNAFDSVFSVNGKLLFGSMLAYMVAQLFDVRTYHFIKKLTRGKHLWLRNNGSTMTSQLVDTAIVNSILFYWGFGWEFRQGVEVMATIYVYKCVLAAIDTPFIYLGVALVQKYLGIEKGTYEPEVDAA